MSSLFGSSHSSDPAAGELPSDGLGSSGTVAKSCVVAGTRLVFELEWSPTQNPSAPEAEFQRARKLGYNYATMLPDKSLVGLATGVQAGPGRPHSAVVMLVERFSSGGAEAVLISVGNRVAFVGLMDRRPVPGFDRLLSGIEPALALLKEFRDIHADQEVRIATDLGAVIPYSEQLQTHTIFEMPESGSLVRALVNRPLRRLVAIGGVSAVALAAVVGTLTWRQYEQRVAAAEAARLALENDPNRIYEGAITGMLAGAGTPGNTALDHWRRLLDQLPLTREGWALQRFDCSQQSGECLATWTRNYGTFQEFQERPPVNAAPPQLSVAANATDLLGASLITHHRWASTEGQAALSRADLPLAASITEDWGSRLQDLSLVEVGTGSGVSLKPAKLFGPSKVSNASTVQRPVVALEWRIAGAVWSLPAIDLPPSAVPNTLSVQLAPTQITYTLTGSVYAKGKQY